MPKNLARVTCLPHAMEYCAVAADVCTEWLRCVPALQAWLCLRFNCCCFMTVCGEFGQADPHRKHFYLKHAILICLIMATEHGGENAQKVIVIPHVEKE